MTEKSVEVSIEKGSLVYFEEILRLYRLAGMEMNKKGYANWSYFYPSVTTIHNDINKGELFLLKQDKQLLGVIALTTNMDLKYRHVKWQTQNNKAMYVNRLAIHPRSQGFGYGTYLMNFADRLAKEHSCKSLRLDAYSPNKGLLYFYQKRGFIIHKETISLGDPWQHPFCCLEKVI